MITIDGESVHPAVAAAYNKLEAAFRKATGKGLVISSGHRTTATQTSWFLSRYRVQSSGGGPYGDVRWWQGRRYVRHSSAGTVAVPGTSLHESYRAIDIRDTGADAGVTTAGTKRANWIRNNAHRYQFNPRGYQFREPWHIEYTGSLTTPAGTDFEEIDMATPAEIWGHVIGARTIDGIKTGQTSAAGYLTTAAAVAVANRARLIALEATVKVLTVANGLDPAALKTLVKTAVDEAIKDDVAAIQANIDQIPTSWNITPK